MGLPALLGLLLTGCFFTKAPGPDSADPEETGDDTGSSGDDTGVVVDTGELVPATVRTFTEPCTVVESIWPAPGEEGHLAAGRIDAPAGFVLSEARIRLVHRPNDGCDAGGAYAASIFLASGSPPSTPTPIASASYAATVPLSDVRTLSLGPPSPVAIAAGTDVFVAFDFSGQADPVACVEVCKTSPHPGTAYWSNGDEPPYAWATLESFGIDADYTFEIDGFVPP